MKSKITFVLSVGFAAMLSASVIEWDLPNLESGNGTSLELDNITFLLVNDSSATELVNSNGEIDTTKATPQTGASYGVDFTDGDYSYGSYSDSVGDSGGGTANYIMAFYNPENGKYYAISDGNEGYITVEVDNSPAARMAAVSTGYPGWSESSQTTPRTTVTTISQSVPEPATAALALAGLAMLIRRRRVA
ncbi:MAG: PEP-CTERM sorting domain-containing protein [Kiritimatiellae bacterium]|nr:PEP-CTERM sorting domain-containing protein [Kiritimatiellia bacterium]